MYVLLQRPIRKRWCFGCGAHPARATLVEVIVIDDVYLIGGWGSRFSLGFRVWRRSWRGES